MSADVVNLNQFRKRKARADKEREAAENRVRFGLERDARTREAREQERERRAWENSRLEGPDDGKEGA